MNERKKVLLLRGNGHHDKKNGHDLESELKILGYDVYFHHYEHWPKEGSEEWNQKPKHIDFDYELDELKSYVKENGQPDYIVAKSVGTVVTKLAIEKEILNPEKVVLMGIPIEKWKHPSDIHEKLENMIQEHNLPDQSMIIQQSKDPFGSYDLLLNKLGSLNEKYILHKIDGENHEYKTEDIIHLIKDYLAE